MKHKLELDYTLGAGALAPYLDALGRGVAMARHCRRCNRTTFPPERLCSCQPRNADTSDLGWRELSGFARIAFRTDGPAGSFALAQFDGADNRSVCRIANPRASGTEAMLQPAKGEKPGITIQIRGDGLEINE